MAAPQVKRVKRRLTTIKNNFYLYEKILFFNIPVFLFCVFCKSGTKRKQRKLRGRNREEEQLFNAKFDMALLSTTSLIQQFFFITILSWTVVCNECARHVVLEYQFCSVQ